MRRELLAELSLMISLGLYNEFLSYFFYSKGLDDEVHYSHKKKPLVQFNKSKKKMFNSPEHYNNV